MISRIKKFAHQMGGSVPAAAQQMAMAATPAAAPQQPFETRVRPLLANIETSLQRFNNDLSQATNASVYLTIFRSADAVEVILSRAIPTGSSLYPMTLSVITGESPDGVGLSLIERGSSNKLFGDRPIIQSLSYHDYEAAKVISDVEQAVAKHLLPEEKKSLDLKVWPNRYPDAPAPSPSGQ